MTHALHRHGTLWAKHVLDRHWHLVAEVTDSIVTLCRGRWPITDVHQVAIGYTPSAEHCLACMRQFGEAAD